MAYLEPSSEEILSAVEEDGQMLQTDEDVRESTSLASSDGSIDRSDVTIRRNAKIRMPRLQDNVNEQLMLEEYLKRLKNSRSGSLSAVTAKKNEINTLLAEDADVKLVLDKYESLKRLVDKYFDAHRAYQCELLEAERIEQADKQYEAQEISYQDFADKIDQWIKTKELCSKAVPEISPNDSVSQVASNVSSKTQYSTRPSVTSELRANEAVRMAELVVQAKSLEFSNV